MIINQNSGMKKKVALYGSTGSIGKNTLDILRVKSDEFQVEILTAYSRVDLLVEQAVMFKPKIVVIGQDALYQELKGKIPNDLGIEVRAGRKALLDVATYEVDYVIAAIVGTAGLEITQKAIPHCKYMGLANKESLICAGDFFIQACKDHGTVLLPIDSEHNSLFQLLQGHDQKKNVSQLVITASGGPFRTKDRSYMKDITAEMAIKHPTWVMGPKISVDCATLVNKGLEVIEAHYLFDMPSEQINVMIHPQSIIHGFVEFTDGSIFAHMGSSDMRVPISYTLSWPERFDYRPARLDLMALKELHFETPDLDKFPLLGVAKNCLRDKSRLPQIFNAANEIAVESFLKEKIGFLDIERVIDHTLSSYHPQKPIIFEDVLILDQEARQVAQTYVNQISNK